ncbi:acyltransferase [Pantoea sp.]|uniref:acyltransferase family protein n=1 Tax=Pantoea sp. TaxID=69393 RepID=UPI0031DC7487
MKDNTGRFFAIDVLRVVSLMMIVLFHFNVEMIIKRGFSEVIGWNGNSYIDLGQVGVGLFMIISGYSLSSPSNIKGVIAFYKKRLLRIFPQFYLCYAICVVILSICNGGIAFNANPQSFFITLIGYDGYLNYKINTFYVTGEWFLGAIISLYLFFPFIVKCTSKMPVLTFISSVVIFYINHKFYQEIYQVNEWNNIITMAVFFVFGSSYRFACEGKSKAIMTIPVVAGVIYIIFARDLALVPTKVAIGITVFSSIMLFFDFLKTNKVTLNSISFLADISFAAFLVHHVVISILTSANRINNPINNNFGLLFMSIAITFLLGWICYRMNAIIINGLKKDRT